MTGWVYLIPTVVIIQHVFNRFVERGRKIQYEEKMGIISQRVRDLSSELQIARMEKHEAIQEAFETERGAVILRQSCSRDEKNSRWVISDNALAMNDKIGAGLRLLKGPGTETKKPEPAQDTGTYFPKLAEGARYPHDIKSDIFLGQFKDSDIYAELWEHVEGGAKISRGLPSGKCGSLLKFRFSDAKRLGNPQMLTCITIKGALESPEDEYATAGAELAEEAGLINRWKREDGEDGVMLFRPYPKKEVPPQEIKTDGFPVNDGAGRR
jgi:hypothetical protein